MLEIIASAFVIYCTFKGIYITCRELEDFFTPYFIKFLDKFFSPLISWILKYVPEKYYKCKISDLKNRKGAETE